MVPEERFRKHVETRPQKTRTTDQNGLKNESMKCDRFDVFQDLGPKVLQGSLKDLGQKGLRGPKTCPNGR